MYNEKEKNKKIFKSALQIQKLMQGRFVLGHGKDFSHCVEELFV